MSNVVNLKAVRGQKAEHAREDRIALMRFRFSDTAIETDDGVGYLATPEEHERFREFCAAFGFDIEEYPSTDERFALWHALADDLIGDVIMCLRHRETFDLVKVVRPPEWAQYIESVATGDQETARRLKDLFVDMSWQEKSGPV